VFLCDGSLIFYVECGGKSIVCFVEFEGEELVEVVLKFFVVVCD